MFGALTSSANKIGPRYRGSAAAAGVLIGRGGAGAGENGAWGGSAGLDVVQVRAAVQIVQFQGFRCGSGGRVASPGVASMAVCLSFQCFVQGCRQIASYRTGSRARVPAAAGGDRGRPAGPGRTPHGGARARLTPGCAWRRSPEKCRAPAPLGTVKAQQGLKNREEISATHGVGGSSSRNGAAFQSLNRLNSRAKSRLRGCKWGRGVSSPAHLWWGKAATVCGGWNRVN